MDFRHFNLNHGLLSFSSAAILSVYATFSTAYLQLVELLFDVTLHSMFSEEVYHRVQETTE